MKLHFRITLWALVLGMLSSAFSVAAEDLNRLQQRLEGMKTLQGDFTQILFDDDGTVLEESQGEFALERPGKFYWHTQEPFEQLLVSDQQFLWLYDPDLEQVTQRSYDQEQVRGTPAAILSDDVDGLGENFSVQYKGADNGRQLFSLRPRVDKDLFQELLLAFTDEGLTEIRVRDNLGQLTIFTLVDVRRNEPVDQRLFEFEPPEGVDVLVD
ncbi:outer membrane lipoprotein chaperone LolA [Marinimicrobium sp. ABcell2]|uniref:outer membrane lipoprotein chaperone LolA n=1 Tax=Marinimicrobium sp. ABcell2 TaxID=3069751 RepID=UPI0027AE0694|nr:outer membrane lipoprotein chaperone LolA [Marinimicrobium sp. ABcell2]MDQ2075447.1 outer membrane lipoprotein chaperone LolA [Marinimicrobium sp. ABcell2]